MARYYEEEPCEHGQVGRHAVGPDRGGRWDEYYPMCSGGSRRELEDVEIVDWCESHFAVSSDGRYCDFSPDGDACRIARAAIISLSGDTE